MCVRVNQGTSVNVCVCVVTPPRTVDAAATGKELEIQVTMINILQQLVASIIAGATNQTETEPNRGEHRNPNTIRSICMKPAASPSSVFIFVLYKTR